MAGSLRARIAPTDEVPEVLRFLITNAYPHAWTVEQLQSCLMVRVAATKRTVAYFWFHWMPDADMALEMHFCATAGHRFLSQGVLSDIAKLCSLVGSKVVVARTNHPGFVKLLRYAGFDRAGQFSFKRIEDNL